MTEYFYVVLMPTTYGEKPPFLKLSELQTELLSDSFVGKSVTEGGHWNPEMIEVSVDGSKFQLILNVWDYSLMFKAKASNFDSKEGALEWASEMVGVEL